jgi:hypothetical protein
MSGSGQVDSKRVFGPVGPPSAQRLAPGTIGAFTSEWIAGEWLTNGAEFCQEARSKPHPKTIAAPRRSPERHWSTGFPVWRGEPEGILKVRSRSSHVPLHFEEPVGPPSQCVPPLCFRQSYAAFNGKSSRLHYAEKISNL